LLKQEKEKLKQDKGTQSPDLYYWTWETFG
jgi:hypothetical protein